MLIKLILVIAVVIMSGCSTYQVNRYSVYVDNIMALKQLNGKKLAVGAFTATVPGKTEIYYAGVFYKAPDGQTFENYIKKAFEDELKIADVYSESAPIILTGNLEAIYPSAGTWNLVLTVNSNNGHSFSVSESHSYEKNAFSDSSHQTAQALMPAVQSLLWKIISSDKFRKLIN